MSFEYVRQLAVQRALEPSTAETRVLSDMILALVGAQGQPLGEERNLGISDHALVELIGVNWRILSKVPFKRQSAAMVAAAVQANPAAVEFAAPHLFEARHATLAVQRLPLKSALALLQRCAPAGVLTREFYLETVCPTSPEAIDLVPSDLITESFLAEHFAGEDLRLNLSGFVYAASIQSEDPMDTLRQAVVWIPGSLPKIRRLLPAAYEQLVMDPVVVEAIAAHGDFDALPKELREVPRLQWLAAQENPQAPSFWTLRAEYLLLAAARKHHDHGDMAQILIDRLTTRAADQLCVSVAQAADMVMDLISLAKNGHADILDPSFDAAGQPIEPDLPAPGDSPLARQAA